MFYHSWGNVTGINVFAKNITSHTLEILKYREVFT